MKRMAYPVLIALTAVAGVTAGTVPAVAGGILPVGNPAFGNTCTNHSHALASASSAASAALSSGNVGQIPAAAAQQSCGGSDLAPASNLFTLLNDAQ
ncbi:hypothetical protein [Streptomyces sp. NPDC057838]|uniref:hypothetical protein n=1 Tax=unclassified Streptomyces TaxID=2593676 RepID=UPI0036B30745